MTPPTVRMNQHGGRYQNTGSPSQTHSESGWRAVVSCAASSPEETGTTRWGGAKPSARKVRHRGWQARRCSQHRDWSPVLDEGGGQPLGAMRCPHTLVACP